MRLPFEQLGGARPRGLYVHVPFCRKRCRYCDFCSTVLVEPTDADRLVEAIGREVAFWARRLDLSRVETVFVGGGTPTVLPPAALQRLLTGIAAAVGPVEEFTVEANPATLDESSAGRLRSSGVNRLSLGAQSFRDEELICLGRLHTAAATAESVRIARSAGFENVSLDLIYGIPGQTLDSWRASLSAAIGLGVEHLSCYALTVEPGTELASDVQSGRLQPPGEAEVVEMYRTAQSVLSAAGFEHYEISNWARAGRRCRHNLLYWRNQPWLGVGPSAASYLAGFRFKAPADIARYARAVEAGQPACEQVERLTGLAALGEAAMLALRLREGLAPDELARQFDLDIRAALAEPIRRHEELGLLAWRSGRLMLTEKALPVADSVLVDFLADSPG